MGLGGSDRKGHHYWEMALRSYSIIPNGIKIILCTCIQPPMKGFIFMLCKVPYIVFHTEENRALSRHVVLGW